jgi:hypothetical protein
MKRTLLKAAAPALILGGFALSGQAFALSPVPIDRAATIAVPITDQEERAVEEHLNPAETPPGPQDEAAPVSPAPEAGRSESNQGGAEVEQQELESTFPSTDWPKK